jgi:hypothetical protein
MMPSIAVRPIVDLEQVTIVFLVAQHTDAARFGDESPGEALELVLVSKKIAIRTSADQRFDDLTRVPASFDDVHQFLVRDRFLQQALELRASYLRSGGPDLDAPPFNRPPDQERFELAFILDVGLRLAALGAKSGGCAMYI